MSPFALKLDKYWVWFKYMKIAVNKDYELLLKTAETFIYLVIIRIMVRRLA